MAKELLTDVTIRNTKPTDKDQRLNDGGGLYLLIKSNGAKWWRFDYTINSKRKTLSLGVYPLDSSLKCNSSYHAALRSFSAKNTAWGVW